MKKDCAVVSEVFFVGGEMGWEGVCVIKLTLSH